MGCGSRRRGSARRYIAAANDPVNDTPNSCSYVWYSVNVASCVRDTGVGKWIYIRVHVSVAETEESIQQQVSSKLDS